MTTKDVFDVSDVSDAPLDLPPARPLVYDLKFTGWTCGECFAFNSAAKQWRRTCRACGHTEFGGRARLWKKSLDEIGRVAYERAVKELEVSSVSVCGARDDLSPRVCQLLKGHEGTHFDPRYTSG
jgi:hypothetical protein